MPMGVSGPTPVTHTRRGALTSPPMSWAAPVIVVGRTHPARVPLAMQRMSEVLDRPVAATSESAARSAAAALVRAWVGREGSPGALLDRIGGVDQVGVNERVDSLKKRSIKQHSKVWALDLTIRMMDLTTLEGKDTPGKVRALCAKAMHLRSRGTHR